MATSLGKLVVSLGLDAAQFIRELTFAENATKKFSKSANTSFKDIAKVVASLGIGALIVDATKDIISSAAALDDLSDATGSSVEALSQLSNQAAIAGTDFATLQTLVLKMSVGMAGMDEETSKAGQALKALGVTTKDPAQAVQEVAVALSKYKDGVEKAALANAIFGKGGAAFLATLKDIAELQDVQATVTAKQAKEAEELEKAWRRLVVESRTFANAILNDAVPAVLALIKEFREGITLAGGFWAALNSDVFRATHPFEDTAEGIQKVTEELDLLRSSVAEASPNWPFLEANIKRIKVLENQLKLLRLRRDEAAKAAFVANPEDTNVRDLMNARLPSAPTLPGGGAAAKSSKQVDDAQKYLDALTKTLERTQDLTVSEQLLVDIREKRVTLTDPQLAEAKKLAAAADGNKELAEQIKKATKAQEERMRVEAQAEEAQKRAAEAQVKEAENIASHNLALSDEIAFIKGGEDALKAIERQRIQEAIAIKEATVAQLLLDDARNAEIDPLNKQIQLLKERLGLLKDKDVAIALKADADAVQALKDTLADAFADSFEGFIMGTKSASQAFKDLANDIERYLLKIALHKIGDQLFGGATSGQGDLFGAILSKLFGSFQGLGTGPFPFPAAAAGTNFSYGGPTVVGEHGPELVDMPRGARIWPSGTGPQQSGGDSIHMENHFHVQGTINSQTVRQIERGIGDSVARNRIDR